MCNIQTDDQGSKKSKALKIQMSLIIKQSVAIINMIELLRY